MTYTLVPLSDPRLKWGLTPQYLILLALCILMAVMIWMSWGSYRAMVRDGKRALAGYQLEHEPNISEKAARKIIGRIGR